MIQANDMAPAPAGTEASKATGARLDTSGGRSAYMPNKAAVEDWTSPVEVLEPVRRIFGGQIALDPCSNPMSIVGARREIWLPKWADELGARGRPLPVQVQVGDGLEEPWEGDTYLNPPYDAKTMTAFMAKARRHAEAGGNAIALVQAKTALKGWHETVPAAAAVCFVEGRLVYGGGDGESAPFPSALVLFTRSRELAHRFAWYLDGKLGHVMFGR